jgi:hypothetical protein
LILLKHCALVVRLSTQIASLVTRLDVLDVDLVYFYHLALANSVHRHLVSNAQTVQQLVAQHVQQGTLSIPLT